MENISFSKRKANKDHKCNYCGGVIKKGEIYEHSVNKIDDIYVWKNHISCSKLVERLEMDGDEGVTKDDFYEYVSNKYAEIMCEREGLDSFDIEDESIIEMVELVSLFLKIKV